MDRPRIDNYQAPPPPPQPLTLSPCSSGRRRISSDSNSPEFEFWMVRNPSSFPQQNLLSADELFVNGFLLPLHLLPSKPPDPEPEPKPSSTETPSPSAPKPERQPAEPEPEPGPEITKSAAATTGSSTVLTASKRWKDIFKKGDKKGATKNQEDREKEKEKDKKREKKSGQSGSSSSSAELNINIWPFSRSRSAGNNGTRPRLGTGAPGTRKVSSAPCSRSNSAGESKSFRRQWPSSPGRAGVHLGRSSPVWQVKRGAGSGVRGFTEHQVRNGGGEKAGVSKKEVTESRRGKTVSGGSDNSKARVLNLNVPMCIGYRHHLSCRSDETGAIGVGGIGGGSSKINGCSGNGGGGGGGATHVHNPGNVGNLFNLRSFFTKKVY